MTSKYTCLPTREAKSTATKKLLSSVHLESIVRLLALAHLSRIHLCSSIISLYQTTYQSTMMDTSGQLRASLIAQNLPTPSTAFLNSLITARNPPPPLPSLLASAKARLLACDLSNANPSSSIIDDSLAGYPSGVEDVHSEETTFSRQIHVQVIDVENLSSSRWEQIEELEAIEKGERTRGREIIRVTDDEESDGRNPGDQQRTPAHSTTATSAANAVHRLVLQDRHGKRLYAVELQRIPKIGIGKTIIGEKILLKAGTKVARGSILLELDKCILLGGKIDAWHEKWTADRLKRLKSAVGADRPV